MKLILLKIFGSLFALINAASTREKENAGSICGYHSCTKSDPDKLNIHLVAHTHDDVGWLKTVDQYYYGEKMDIQNACVQDIINSVVDALVKDPKRKFIYVETAFLWKWLYLQNEEKRKIMHNFIDEGRLEIIGGGWSMNDEATTHYRSMVDQYTWGFRRLNDTFGECARPKIGWQIDPFGHSREQASMFAQLGFDGLLFGRLDYQDKEQRLKDQTAEFIWKGSPNLGLPANIFTSVLYHLYQPPDGFCFDTLCRAEEINDNLEDPEYNLDRKVVRFLQFVEEQSAHYRTNNIIITMGGDFTYQDAELYYKNIDKLIRGINKLNGTQYNAFYSTPSCYLKAVNEQNLTWTTKSDDFFPYANEPNAYWTGYFTSRPTLKFFERLGNNFLQVVKQLTSLTNTPDSLELELFREAMGILQHHDAVTGTEKQHVADDYARILHHSMKNGQRLASNALRKWATKQATHLQTEFHTCFLLNISLCSYSAENPTFVVTVYNPTSQPLDTYVRLPVQGSEYTVLDYNGRKVITQIVPIPTPLLKLPGRDSDAKQELVFHATNIAPFGYQSFYAKQESNNDEVKWDQYDSKPNDIKNLNYVVSVNKDNNKILVQGLFGIEYEQSFEYYESADGVNMNHNRSSGAYIFRPRNNYTKQFLNEDISFQVFKGPLVEEIHQTINGWTSQVIRVYQKENYVEFDWLVGPIPVADNIGKEIITKYSSNLNSEDEFYTDSNGREMLKRKLNYRPTWDLELKETISGNYYPVTAKISIEDTRDSRRLSVFNDRAQGGSSLRNGEIELMIHRRMLNDDGFGVDEYLNETAYGRGLVARGQHLLVVGNLQDRDDLFVQEKEQAVKLALRPWIFISPTDFTFEEWNHHHHMVVEDVIGQLPKNIHILTCEPWKDDYVLLRLEHLFELDESPIYSVTEEVNLKELFPKFNIISVAETTLGANQYIEENHRLKWIAQENEESDHEDKNLGAKRDSFVVSLKPMEIRTYLVKVSEFSSVKLG